MRVLVTGGTGFIGSHIAKYYLDRQAEVIITGTRSENVVPGAKLVECHFNGLDYWNKAMRGKFDVVFHQAANNDTLETDWDEMEQANFDSPTDLFLHLADQGCRQFVYASSTAIYGNGPVPYSEKQEPQPLNAYARSKLLFETDGIKEVQDAYEDAHFVGLRYCNVYGPDECHKGRRSSMIRQLIIQMMRGQRPRLFKHGEQRRDWIYVRDVVAANVAAASYAGSGVFNCGSGVATSFDALVAEINAALGTDLVPEYIDNPHAETYQTLTQCDMKKARDFLSFVPGFDLKTALAEYVPYLREKYGK